MKTVHLIDDDFVYRKTTSILLRKFNPAIAISEFSDGADGIEYLRTHTTDPSALPDLILLDINMPFMDGWEFLDSYRHLKEQFLKHPSIYLVTSSLLPSDRERAAKESILSGFMVKPIMLNDIQSLLQEAEAV